MTFKEASNILPQTPIALAAISIHDTFHLDATTWRTCYACSAMIDTAIGPPWPGTRGHVRRYESGRRQNSQNVETAIRGRSSILTVNLSSSNAVVEAMDQNFVQGCKQAGGLSIIL